MKSSVLSWLGRIAFACLLWFSVVSGASAQTAAALEKGKSWLQAQVQPDGVLLAVATNLAMPMQTEAEVLRSLAVLSSPPQALVSRLSGAAPAATELLARNLLAVQSAGQVNPLLGQAVVERQVLDGGFAAHEGLLVGSVTDTAMALGALAAAAPQPAFNKDAAFAFLLGRQNADGGFSVTQGADSDVYTSSLVMHALWQFRSQASLASALGSLKRYLEQQAASQSNWGADERAGVLIALLPTLASSEAVSNMVMELVASQGAAGDWAGDAYVTALVLRALEWSLRDPTNPDLGGITGRVLDAATGLPITGVSISLAGQGREVASDVDGLFRIAPIEPGTWALAFSADGYRPFKSNAQIQPGQELELGDVRLYAGNATDVLVQGVAQYVINSAYRPAAGASITINGRTVTTAADGSYSMPGLSAGGLNITATHSGYKTLTASVTAQAGEVLSFDPVFTAVETAGSATVRVVIRNGQTLQPLSGVSVRLNTTSRTTDAQGVTTFTSGVLVGSNAMEVGRTGYEYVQVRFDAVSGQSIEIPLTINPVASAVTALKGTVIDQFSGAALAGVAVTVAGTSFEGLTGSSGEYAFEGAGLSGQRTVTFSLAGYVPVSQTLPITAGRTSVFNVQLAKPASPSNVSSLSVEVLARDTASPLAGAQVTLSGANNRSLTADASGKVLVGDLVPGPTSIDVRAQGYESVRAEANIKAGVAYVLPVDLAPTLGLPELISGQVVDAVTRAPLAGVTMSLTGAHTASTSTDASGYYEFPNPAAGGSVLSVERNGYSTQRLNLSIQGRGVVNIALEANWAANNAYQVFGRLVDANTLEPISGAQVLLEELVPGMAVLATQQTVSATGGDFSFEGLTEANARVMISFGGYDTTVVPFEHKQQSSQTLGDIKLRRAFNAALPDLQIAGADRSGLVIDPQTFVGSGQVLVTVKNNSSYDAGGFRTNLFIDVNRNNQFDADTDHVLGVLPLASLAALESQVLTFDVPTTIFDFRDAPIYAIADGGLEVLEVIEGNNTLRISVECSSQGDVQDLGICIDTSGSVANLYTLELEGVIKAIENPNILPHDGSVRLSVGTDYEMYYGTGIVPRHPAVVLTPQTVPLLISDLRSSVRRSGYSSGPTCANRFSQYFNSLTPSANSRSMVLVGDGYWEGIPKANSLMPGTVANGVKRIDVIGVGGSTNRSELEANAWPKPVNTVGGGKVTIATTAAQVADAMALTLSGVIRSVDLTVGRFRVIDQGAGKPYLFTARVGSAGTRSQPTTLRFYQGAVLVGELPVSALAEGAYQDLSLEVPTLASQDDISALVDEQRINAECNLANNRQQRAYGDVAMTGMVQALADQTLYQPGTTAQLSAQVLNSGQFEYAYEVQLRVEDAMARPVIQFDRAAVPSLLPGQSHTHTVPWPLGTTQSGGYRLVADLFDLDGQLIHSGAATLAIGNGVQGEFLVTGAVATNKPVYASTEQVRISATATNLSPNRNLEQLHGVFTVISPSGNVVFQEETHEFELPASGVVSAKATAALIDAPVGNHVARFVVVDVQGAELSRSEAVFAVVGTEATGAGLRGSLVASPQTQEIGRVVSLSAVVTHEGAQEVTGLPLTIRLVHPESGALLAEHAVAADMAAGGSYATSTNWTAAGSAGDQLIAVLLVRLPNGERELARTLVTLTEPAIRLEVAADWKQGARLLVLAACAGSDKAPGHRKHGYKPWVVHHDGCGENCHSCDPHPRPTCGLQRAEAIDDLLNGLGIAHRVTTDPQVFLSEMRTGAYNTYWVSGDVMPLDHYLLKELREVVRRGAGLMVDGAHSRRNSMLDDVAGVAVRGQFSGGLQHQGLVAQTDGVVFAPAQLRIAGYALRLDPRDAEVRARAQENRFRNHPVITEGAFGQGATLFFGLDFMNSVGVDAGWRALLDQAINRITPQLDTDNLWPYSWLPGSVSLRNLGAQAQAGLQLTLPDGVALASAQPQPQPDTDNDPATEHWRIDLSAGASATVNLALRTGASTPTVPVVIQPGHWLDQTFTPAGDSVTFAFEVNAAAASLSTAQSAADSLVVARSDRNHLWKAQLQLMQATGAAQAQQWSLAIRSLLLANGSLDAIRSADTRELQLAIARALAPIQWQWSEAQ